MGEPESKAVVRERMRRVRDGLPAGWRDGASRAIAERVLALDEVESLRGGGVVFTYVSFRSEVATHDLIRGLLERGVMVAVPRITGPGQMEPHWLRSLEELAPGPYGILSPPADAAVRVPPGDVGVTLVPGLAFRGGGERLGYGAGHYDRWLAAHGAGLTIGLAFEAQVVEDVPTEAHDRRMDVIVTEARVIRCA